MTSKNKQKLINQAVDGFRHNKGKGSLYCFTKEVIPELVCTFIKLFNAKNKGEQVFIVVDSYNTRQSIIHYLTQNDVNAYNGYNYKIISNTYINGNYRYCYKLIITIGINDDIRNINHLYSTAAFMLCILTKNIMKPCFINEVRSKLPNIGDIDISKDIINDNIYSPVEEHHIGVDLSDDALKEYNECTEYINTTISIIGDIDNIEKCKYGDAKLGISSIQYRYNIAEENGWNEHLDVRIPIFKQIDDAYNPTMLLERANNFYNVAKVRRDIAMNNSNKLDTIIDICNKHKGKKILIISKSGEFAKSVTNYINNNSDNRCGDYHDCIDDKPLYDEYGEPVLVKSGVNKGKIRIVSSQFQSTQNELKFNTNNSKSINVLSIKNSSNNKLKIACDVVIFTTPLCDNIVDFKTRFANVKFANIPTIAYKIYSNNTIENDKLFTNKYHNIIKIVNDNDNDDINYDENTNEIIL